ncbi:LysR family transcriptional regulator [Actinocatenispora thailandica]|uniref:LysR family transcriptional regulator n=1 Tax=Actinocatenispora thailandica TaxID=227318 RepID=A0A7R7DRV2_9ACTN|nr:LysR family transcriptional regulator [Actinocatenispora thailandica]BCJ36674.1 LysR family transcriptional regulator [Actinocatenispora thailandica]
MDRLETRELAYFLAVAEELHFGRAAERLGIAQPALSRAVARLERRLGVGLFDRTSRVVALTSAGRMLVEDARHALDAVSAAARRAQRAGAVTPRLVLAIKVGGDAGRLPELLARYQRESGVLPVHVIFEADRPALLRDGRADAALLYDPIDDLRGFDTQPLLTDPPIAVLPAAHPLAARTGISQDELRGETVHRREDGAVGSIDELMHRIALGQLVAVLPRSLTVPLRSDLAAVPVTDVEPVTLVLAWPAYSTSPSVAALARAAESLT